MNDIRNLMKNNLRVYYDSEGDFFELGIGKPSKCYAEEVKLGIFIRKDERTKNIKGIGVLGFEKRTKNFKPIIINFS